MTTPTRVPAPAPAGRTDVPARPLRNRLNPSELRMACMRVARRVRTESSGAVSPGQFGVLANLDRHGAKTPGELAVDECVQAPSMTRTISGMAERGWVTRAEHPTDRRQVLVSITDTGRATVRAARRQRDEWMTRRVAGLTEHEKKILADATPILAKLADS